MRGNPIIFIPISTNNTLLCPSPRNETVFKQFSKSKTYNLDRLGDYLPFYKTKESDNWRALNEELQKEASYINEQKSEQLLQDVLGHLTPSDDQGNRLPFLVEDENVFDYPTLSPLSIKTFVSNESSYDSSSHSLSSPLLESPYPSTLLYKIMETIGEGAHGKVKLAIHLLTGEYVAIKCISKLKLKQAPGSNERLLREIYILSSLDHPHICPLLQVIETPDIIYLVMEYGGKEDLLDYINQSNSFVEKINSNEKMNHGGNSNMSSEKCSSGNRIMPSIHGKGLNENDAKIIFKKMVDAVLYCHEHGIAHRDIKPDNILINEDLEPKLIDFGFANLIRKEDSLLQTACGSLAYSAPEMLLKKSYDGQLVDVWSLGVLLFCMVCGNVPFDDQHEGKLVSRIITAQYKVPSHVSAECKTIIHALLKVKPEQRMCLKDVLSMPWLSSLTESSIENNQSENMDTTIQNGVTDMGSNDFDNHNLDYAIIDQITSTFMIPQRDLQNQLQSSFPGYISATYKLLLNKKRREARIV